MNILYDNWDLWQKLLTMLEHQFGGKSEFILHDLTKDYSHTIVDIRNGYITNRRVGDCGSNLGLEVLRGTVENGDRFNYIVNTPDGKLLRSSTMFISDENGKVVGSLCINTDITETVQFEAFLRQYNQFNLQSQNAYSPNNSSNNNSPLESDDCSNPEFFANDVVQLLDYLMVCAQELVGKPVELMTREDKIKYIDYLDKKGALLITKSAERIYEYLGISRYTFYNYLEAGRNGSPDTCEKQEDL